MDPSQKILIIGAGYLGQRIAHFACASGWSVFAARRQPPMDPGLDPISWLSIDVTSADSVRECLHKASSKQQLAAAVYCVSAGEPNENAYKRAYEIGVRNIIEHLPTETQLAFISSTGVYHQNSGESVDESSPTNPLLLSKTQSHLLTGESLVINRPNSVIARLSGIYGPGRTRLISMAQAMNDPYIVDRQDYTNRIHVDDGARAVLHLLKNQSSEKIYCVTDHEPAPQLDVVMWIRSAMAMPPIQVRYRQQDTFVTTPDQLPSFNKRISNQRLLNSGFKFHFPTFREGYGKLL